jgi:hypothetical protein
MPINSFLYPAPSTPSFAYNVANSLRLDEPSNQGLTKTPSGAGNRKTFTLSIWVKRAKITNQTGDVQHVFESRADSNDNCGLLFNTDDTLQVKLKIGGSNAKLITNRLFRDVSSWMHIVVAVDTTQGTSSNRNKLYINGVQETSFGTEQYPSQDAQTSFNNSVAHAIGKRTDVTTQNFDGYLTEVVMIDGQALDPTSFGEFDEDSPTIWKPKDVSGLTFGTNGFYLDFENASSLGADVSGNSNNFTVNNLTSVDQSTDTCTNNWCTMNPLDNYYAGGTFAEGNLKLTSGSSQFSFNTSTFQMVSGKWYWEAKVNSSGASGNYQWGIVSSPATTSSNALQNYSNSVGVNDGNYNIFANGSSTGITIGSFAQNDILMFAFDADNNGLYVGKNGTWLNSGDPTSGASKTGAFTPGTSGIGYFAAFGDQNGSAGYISELNFGGTQTFTISSGNSDGNGYGNFEYSVPSGYYALNTKNLAEFG